MKYFLLTFFAISSFALANRELPIEGEGLELNRLSEIRQAMDSYVITELDITDASIRDTIKVLMDRTKSAEMSKIRNKTFSYIVSFDPNSSDHPKINIHKDAISLPDVLNSICEQSDFYWRCDGKISILQGSLYRKRVEQD